MIRTRFDVSAAGFALSLSLSSLSSLSSFEGGGAGGAKQSPRYCTTLGCRACCIRVISRAMYFSTSYSVLGKTSLMATCRLDRLAHRMSSPDPRVQNKQKKTRLDAQVLALVDVTERAFANAEPRAVRPPESCQQLRRPMECLQTHCSSERSS